MRVRRSRAGATASSAAPERKLFERRARRARTLRWRPVLLTLLAVALVAGAVYLVWFSPVLTVQKVVVQGVSGTQAESVRAAAAIPTGVPLARVDLSEPGRRVTRSPLYDSVAVSRRWPSEIVVSVTPRTPVLALRLGQQFQLVDAKGVAYQAVPTAPKGVPVATGEGEVTPQGLRAAISVMSALPARLRDTVTAVKVEGPSMVTFQLGTTKVLWGDESDPQLKVKVLQLLLPKKPSTINVSAPGSPATT